MASAMYGRNQSHEPLVGQMLEGLISVSARHPNETDPEYMKFKDDVNRRVLLAPFYGGLQLMQWNKEYVSIVLQSRYSGSLFRYQSEKF